MLTAATISSFLRHSARCAVRLSVLHSHVAPAFTWGVGRHFCTSTSRPTASSDGVTSHYAEVNGARIHYEKTGGGGHSLLLLPGALGSTRTDFGPQIEKLSREKYTIYAFDPRGYGKSVPPERDWPLEFLQRDAEDAVALMQSQKQSRFSILGWSNGGTMGLIIAARYPSMVRRLVVWGSVAYVSPSEIFRFKQLQDFSQWRTEKRESFVKMYGMDHLKKLWQSFDQAFTNYLEKRNGNVCIEEAKKVRCPTLIVHGQKDALVCQEHPDYLHANIPGSVLVNWPKAKHNLHLKHADEFNRLVEEFLDKDD